VKIQDVTIKLLNPQKYLPSYKAHCIICSAFRGGKYRTLQNALKLKINLNYI